MIFRHAEGSGAVDGEVQVSQIHLVGQDQVAILQADTTRCAETTLAALAVVGDEVQRDRGRHRLTGGVESGYGVCHQPELLGQLVPVFVFPGEKVGDRRQGRDPFEGSAILRTVQEEAVFVFGLVDRWVGRIIENGGIKIQGDVASREFGEDHRFNG